MKSKTLVLTALSHKEPKRVPVDYWGTRDIDELLCRYYRVGSKDELLKELGVDLRYVFPVYMGPKLKKYEDGSYDDLWGVRRRTLKTLKGNVEHTVFSPLKSISTIDELESWSPPSPEWYDYSSLRPQCENYQDYATVIVGDRTNRTSVLHEAMYLRGVQQALTDPIRNPEFTHRLYEKITEFYLEVNRRCFETVGDKIDIFMMGDDMGTQEGLLVSPKIFRHFIKPHLSAHVKLAKQFGLKVMLHSCGAVRKLIPDFIEMGINILNPIQVRATGMNPMELKNEFGDRLSFHGSIRSQGTHRNTWEGGRFNSLLDP
jgi:uroporphyrinogen decarboxylase